MKDMVIDVVKMGKAIDLMLMQDLPEAVDDAELMSWLRRVMKGMPSCTAKASIHIWHDKMAGREVWSAELMEVKKL